MALTNYTAVELIEMIAKREVSSFELTQACLARIESLESKVHAFISVDRDGAEQRARAIDDRRQRGDPVGPLAGIPIAVKDVLCVANQTTTCGSRMLSSFRPPYSATAVEKLNQADAVLIGKTNMDEFAMGSSTENSAFETTRNPWQLDHIPGGSSGGSAACVASDMTPWSIGTDTGGSIRQPAAFCGIVGLKPTYGRVSRYGLVAFASSLDQIGPMTHTAADAALLLAGGDPRDSTSAHVPVPNYSQSVHQPLEGLKLGIVREHFGSGLDVEVGTVVEEAIHVYRKLGAKVSEVSLPHSRFAVATYYIIAPCEASGNLARYDGAHYGHRCEESQWTSNLEQERKLLADQPDALGDLDSPLVRMYRQTRAEGFGSEVKRRIMLGTYALSKGYYDAYYLKALKVRRLIRQDFDKAFDEVDLICGPVAPSPAFAVGEKSQDPMSMYLGDLYTVSANLAGIAGISIPCGFSQSGLPIGFQLQAPPLGEEKLLRAAHMFQQETDWHRQRPEL